ncbi:RAMP superfamily protein [archaeon BMS3Bbin15]|nr:RAMP superfamily protein [archaeon BMS3Bbin15]
MSEKYTHQRFLSMALDPIHVGTGGYRLGSVDNSIVREPGTNLPKIPGSSLLGVARSYAAMRYGKPEAAGRHKKFKGDKNRCPIIYTFGTSTETGGGKAGSINISDAQILFFPVYSMAGPVWVSTREILEEAGFLVNSLTTGDDSAYTNLKWKKEDLNLGWLMLNIKPGLNITTPDSIKGKKEWNAVANRIVLVSPKLFSQIVNSNLEVRTSVAIDPETGAAEDKALFTYEALPRTTWLWFDVVEDDYLRKFKPTSKQFKRGNGDNFEENAGDPLEEQWNTPLDVARAGLKLIEYLGVGGMGTRGFGRMKLTGDWEVDGGLPNEP